MSYQLTFKPNESAYDALQELFSEFTLLALMIVCICLTNLITDPDINNNVGIVFTLTLMQYLLIELVCIGKMMGGMMFDAAKAKI